MTSLFRARRRSEDEGRSGGKILRGRRAAPSASPYLRPQGPTRPPSSPPPAQSPNPSWISGLISGAGKLISSVFASDSSSTSSSTSSSGYSSDEDIISTSDDDNIGASSEELHALNKGGNKPELKKDHVVASSAIIPISESKLAIEQLLMQETFSRDECRKLMEIIQARVVDNPSVIVGGGGKQIGFPNNTTGSAISFPGAYQSLKQHSKLQVASPHSSSSLISSPGLSVLQARTPDLHTTAVMEAKKWLKEKRTATSSNANLDCGPCTLNTDMLQYGIEGEVGSPVDMAKSYMQSLPPWQSPYLCNIGFKTPPPSAMHLYKAETRYPTSNHSLPTSKALKRNYHSIGTWEWDKLEEIRRVRLKATDNLLEIPNYRQTDLSTSLLDHRTTKITSATERRELHAEDQCTNEARSLPNEKSDVVNHPVEIGNTTSVSIISKSGEALDAGQSINESSEPTTLEPSHSQIGSATKCSDPDVHNLDINHNVEEPSQTKERIGTVSVPQESLVLASTPMEHDGTSHSEEDPLSETKKMLPEEIKSAVSCDADDVHSPIIQSSSGVGEGLQSDSKQEDGNDDAQIQQEEKGSRDKITDNGAPAESNASSDPESLGTREPTRDVSEGTAELVSEASVEVRGAKIGRGKSENGTRMKSIERMLAEPRPGTSRRGKKAVVRPKRGRGRAK